MMKDRNIGNVYNQKKKAWLLAKEQKREQEQESHFVKHSDRRMQGELRQLLTAMFERACKNSCQANGLHAWAHAL